MTKRQNAGKSIPNFDLICLNQAWVSREQVCVFHSNILHFQVGFPEYLQPSVGINPCAEAQNSIRASLKFQNLSFTGAYEVHRYYIDLQPRRAAATSIYIHRHPHACLEVRY